MAILFLETASGHAYSLALGCSLVVISLVVYLFYKPAFPKNAPQLATDGIPLIGHVSFFTERWTWWERARNASSTGNFSFYAGQHPVIGVSGEEERRVFLEDKRLDFSEGYATLLAGAPEVKKDDNKLLAESNNDSAFVSEANPPGKMTLPCSICFPISSTLWRISEDTQPFSHKRHVLFGNTC